MPDNVTLAPPGQLRPRLAAPRTKLPRPEPRTPSERTRHTSHHDAPRSLQPHQTDPAARTTTDPAARTTTHPAPPHPAARAKTCPASEHPATRANVHPASRTRSPRPDGACAAAATSPAPRGPNTEEPGKMNGDRAAVCQRFAERLRRLRRDAGQPSLSTLRRLSERLAAPAIGPRVVLTESTTHDILTGHRRRLPRLALGGRLRTGLSCRQGADRA